MFYLSLFYPNVIKEVFTVLRKIVSLPLVIKLRRAFVCLKTRVREDEEQQFTTDIEVVCFPFIN